MRTQLSDSAGSFVYDTHETQSFLVAEKTSRKQVKTSLPSPQKIEMSIGLSNADVLDFIKYHPDLYITNKHYSVT